jgi:hypothetical protein
MVQYIADFINSIQGLRKTLVMVGLMLMSCILRIKGYISGDNLSDMLKGTVVAFMAGNATEHITTAVKTFVDSKGSIKKETVLEETSK